MVCKSSEGKQYPACLNIWKSDYICCCQILQEDLFSHLIHFKSSHPAFVVPKKKQTNQPKTLKEATPQQAGIFSN